MPTVIDAVDAEAGLDAQGSGSAALAQASSIKHLGPLYVRLIKAIQVLQEFAVFLFFFAK